MPHPITPCIWCNHNAQEMADYYVRIFPGSNITQSTPVMVTMQIAGTPLALLNGGPQFRPNTAISFFVVLETPQEIDQSWAGLAEGGQVMMELGAYSWSARYGWLQDRYGVNWQLFLGSRAEMNGGLIPALMFTGAKAGKAEEAIQFYTKNIAEGRIVDLSRYEAGEHDVEGYLKHGRFLLHGQPFAAIDSSFAHGVDFNEAISFILTCDTQAEIDHYWAILTEGGQEQMCGWLKDRYGLSWQVIPSILPTLMADPAKSGKVIERFLQMKKFDIQALLLEDR
jgi:predicted 3-demethylubiquinone-9 3-methyltransferase (glyoxalase superfamily)